MLKFSGSSCVDQVQWEVLSINKAQRDHSGQWAVGWLKKRPTPTNTAQGPAEKGTTRTNATRTQTALAMVSCDRLTTPAWNGSKERGVARNTSTTRCIHRSTLRGMPMPPKRGGINNAQTPPPLQQITIR